MLGVLLFHADGLLPGGYLGVDLFFVLSGYLITSLLLLEHASTGRLDLGAFWVRRARRLMPALFVLLPAVALYARFVARAGDLPSLRSEALATLGYVANWRAILAEKSYWDLFVAPSPLEHTWSLSIEEQFYVIWPLVVGLVLRRGAPRKLFGLSLGLGLASTLACAWLFHPAKASRVYLGTDTRAAGILFGAAFACVLRPTRSFSTRAVRAMDAVGVIAVVSLALAWTRLEGESPRLYRGGLFATELAVLAVIACAVQGQRSFVARALSLRPLAWLGTVSYGVYLWHWPVDVVLTAERTKLAPLPLNALRLAVTFAIAVSSLKLVETPIRKRGLPFGRAWIVVPSVTAALVLALVVSTRARPVQASPIARGTTKILVVGDSVAMALGERMRFVQSGTDADVVVRGVGDCSLLEGVVDAVSLNNTAHAGGNCAAKWATDAEEIAPKASLVVLGGGFFAKAKIDGRLLRACDARWREAFAVELEQKLGALRSRGAPVVVALAPYPVGRWEQANPRELVTCFNELVTQVASSLDGVTVLDLQHELCPGGACAVESAGAPIRPDGVHFDGQGAEAIARWTLREMLATTERPTKPTVPSPG